MAALNSICDDVTTDCVTFSHVSCLTCLVTIAKTAVCDVNNNIIILCRCISFKYYLYKVLDRETNRCARWIKEAVYIRMTAPTANRDEGGLHTKSRDSLLAAPSNE